ncbi:helix-turn-helix domain-containing protein [Planococcus halocryophilus]|uniref:HTH cro/C1-type domain-containing protein n=1 Tax=Planococcus halocryophilus TaxID=1215089 RepID=A0A1C7DM55_9BACL|nr:helix-turn-helix transcriptional regulator [Planococcus halocryophilus]ANU12545.1 hypothetical protein BBI08_01150 [Planococcus halocryophilus]
MKLTGNFLKFTRNMMHLNQYEMAEKLGITRGLLSVIEIGIRGVSERTENRFFEMLKEEQLGLFELTELYSRFKKMNRGR